jgi:hypothetical protein
VTRFLRFISVVGFIAAAFYILIGVDAIYYNEDFSSIAGPIYLGVGIGGLQASGLVWAFSELVDYVGEIRDVTTKKGRLIVSKPLPTSYDTMAQNHKKFFWIVGGTFGICLIVFLLFRTA